jgi:DeoR family transcriptional regulator, aga operon transcriptional repressor
MASINRLDQIQELIRKNHRVTISEVSEQFDVSIATARRDLDTLAEIGKVQRIRGGAMLTEKAPPELPVFQRTNEQADEKARIGAATAALIQDGDSVFLGSGTTILEVARHLEAHRNLTVITNSLLVENALANRQDINLVILGGFFRSSEYTVYGHITEHDLTQVNVNKVILGIRAISLEQGLTNDFLPEVSTDRAILRSGKEIIIAADYTKFNRVSTATVCSLSCVHKIVTDDKASKEFLDSIRGSGIEVIVA